MAQAVRAFQDLVQGLAVHGRAAGAPAQFRFDIEDLVKRKLHVALRRRVKPVFHIVLPLLTRYAPVCNGRPAGVMSALADMVVSEFR
ncbi:hypothetical protein D9M68_958580 [compost metagenome]